MLRGTCWIAVIVLLAGSFGCSSDRTEGTRSVEDSLAEMEQARKSLDTPVVAASSESTAPSSTDLMSGDEVIRSGDAATADSVPASFKVRFESSAGDYVVEVHRDWAPQGAKRFYELVTSGFYDDCRYFRVVPGFMVQFGINGDPAVQQRWDREIQDDPVKKSNRKGYVTFAKTGQPNSRTTQIFISYADNSFLDADGFAPFGQVVEGMHNVEAIFSGHGEKPNQGRIEAAGNQYLNSAFPDLDYVKKATIVEEAAAAAP